ncbi:CYTH domain-containing protein [Anaerosporobacter faecicola]|uniref:CYTH domain-containing protein n=1 Tax=Anaerosporobacter faecicola TaxID=2718714 RepID=UPI00143A78DF|nr:CYTH domain-containing protein [Anaerosporobacter faecicola]
MEIEKKYRVKQLPSDLEQYEKKELEQGYLCTNPIVRIRRSNEDYILTYKSKFGLEDKRDKNLCIANEIEVMLGQEGYEHLRTKVDGQLITKTRYCIPLGEGLTAELDLFKGQLAGLYFVEVEFPDEETAERFTPPDWFGTDVSKDRRFKNNYLSTIDGYEKSMFD